jgi:hypothetical protein
MSDNGMLTASDVTKCKEYSVLATPLAKYQMEEFKKVSDGRVQEGACSVSTSNISSGS